jgi:predicted Zn-ribbon and HTH transcriptional regulator
MTHLLIILAIIAGYGLFTLVRPHMACRKCSGWGSKTRRRRVSACGRCKGTGKVFRPGARLVHRGAALAIRSYRERKEGAS